VAIQPWLVDWMGGFTSPQNEVLSAPSAIVESGDRVRVTVTYPTVLGWPALAGFWMTSHVTVWRGRRLVDQAAGRLYVPPWVEPQWLAVVVEVPGFGMQGAGSLVLPAGSWAIPTRWQVALAHAWPGTQWAAQHIMRAISMGASLVGIPTQVTVPTIRVHGSTERGSGVVRYAGPG
jgi:hypothetical protein